MENGTSTRYFRVERRDIVFLKFITEAHEGLSTMSTTDNTQGIVAITFEAWAARDVSSLLESLAREIPLVEVTGNRPEEDCRA